MGYNDVEFLRTRIVSFEMDDMDAILDSVLKRYTELAPESEMICLFLPRNNMEERKRILTQSVEFLLKHPAENEK